MIFVKKNLISLLLIVALLVVGFFLYESPNQKRNEQKNENENVNTLSYLHGDNTFSFSYPESFSFSPISELDEKGKINENIIFQGKKKEENFQIYISGFDMGSVTIARIKKDIPDIVTEDAYDIFIDGVSGAAFISVNKESGFKTREIWFSHGSKLYQITTYLEFDEEIVKILETWKWK